MSPLRMAISLLSPAAAGARLSVFIFHRVLPEPDALFPDEVHAARFDQMLAWIKTWFQVLPLDEAVQQLGAGRLPARAAAITFDDGYEDNDSVARPLLRRHGLTATFFIATGFLDGGRMWNDTVIESIRRTQKAELDLRPLGLGQHALASTEARRAAIAQLLPQLKYQQPEARLALTQRLAHVAEVSLPADLMMRSEQLLAMRRAGMQIGAHTVSHPILARLDLATARQEMAQSKQALEQLLGEPVTLFAYPNGRPGKDYLPEHAQLARELGFQAAVSTAWGAARQGCDPFQVPRFTPWDHDRLRFGLRMIRNLRLSA
ncbi:polysaccharide deacetylase family protein [Paucibacter soli]|uniref:polysaccharide deacetylase family protein n=1 Tax=Paucibacter soli TaxID=3133433 RepID=UPI0030B55EFD